MSSTEVVSRAPARVCLFGDHQDYLELPIIACAIDRYIEIRGVPNDIEEFRFDLLDLSSIRSFSIHETFDNLEKGDHIVSVLRVLRRYGCVPDRGYTITIQGDIPINAGLSSSSAVVVAWIRFLLKAFGSSQEITNEFIARIAYEAEVIEHNSPGGKMDQYTIAIGDIIYLKTDDSSEFVKIEKRLKGLIVAESGTPKDTVGLLGDRKGKALDSIRMVKESFPDFELHHAKLYDVEQYLKVLSPEFKPIFYAAIENHDITQEAFQVLQQEKIDYERLGLLMSQHHTVLKYLLKITTPKIDEMIEAALNAGAYGAKIVGSGGGGSICAIAPEQKQQEVVDAIQKVSGQNAYLVEVTSVRKEDYD